MALLDVKDLRVEFRTADGVVHAVNGVSFEVDRGRVLGIVGESGSGKSVTCLTTVGLTSRPGVSRQVSGTATFKGRDLLTMTGHELRQIRGRDIAMIFQDPMTSLNPVLTIGAQLAEGLRRHMGMNAARAREEGARLLGTVGIPNAADRLSDHPHQFSGGQRQRIMIAIALACRPSVLIADEPTTALDVTIQAQIVELVKDLQRDLGMAILWITHDLSLVAGLVDRVAVMYAGSIVEEAPVRAIFRTPSHPYTVGLLRSMPSVDIRRGQRLESIAGRPPDLLEEPESCPFAPRCPWAEARCHQEKPPLRAVGDGHASACWRWEDVSRAVRS
jgi:oligopeptide/dipeptide ABC transporter ATP-binding protein